MQDGEWKRLPDSWTASKGKQARGTTKMPRAVAPNAQWAASPSIIFGADHELTSSDRTLRQEWVQEAADQADARGSKAGQAFNQAAKAIKKCKEKMTHPSEAQKLPGVGPKVVEIVMRKLQAWCEENGEVMPMIPAKGAVTTTSRIPSAA